MKITENKIINKVRRTLSMTKEEFQARMAECVGVLLDEKKIQDEEETEVNLIPIVVFNDNDYQIEHVEIVTIAENVDIGISYKISNINNKNQNKNNKNNNNCGVEVTSIYVDKAQLIDHHHLISPQHIGECKCFESFKTNIDVLHIGNPDDKDNKINALQNQVRDLKKKVKDLEQSNNYLHSPMPSGSNSPRPNSGSDKSDH